MERCWDSCTGLCSDTVGRWQEFGLWYSVDNQDRQGLGDLLGCVSNLWAWEFYYGCKIHVYQYSIKLFDKSLWKHLIYQAIVKSSGAQSHAYYQSVGANTRMNNQENLQNIYVFTSIIEFPRSQVWNATQKIAKGLVYLDYLQNIKAKLLPSAYQCQSTTRCNCLNTSPFGQK